jgi:hypothetical protein
MDAQEALHNADGALNAAVGLALPHRCHNRGSAGGHCLRDGVAQRRQRGLTVASDEYTAAVAELAHTGDRAVDRLGDVGPLVREAPCSHGSGVAVAHHQERREVLLIISADERVIERHFWHLTRHTLLTAMWGGVQATLDACIAPRPER